MAENNEYFLTLPAFEEASQKVKEVTVPTELIYSDYFSNQSGNKVYLKPENMQRTGAYKIRGAYYRISKLSDEERARGVVTASAGNHAQGVALAAQQFGCKATIVMPTTTPLIKVNRTKALGAEVVLFGDVYDEACQKALRLAEEEGSTFVHPFDDPGVATGQGSIAMEILQELPLVDYILVPIGGGGLATGVSTLVKLLRPDVKVIGVEPDGAACLKASLKEGKPVTLPNINTIADGTAVKTPGSNVFPYLQKNLDEIITVPDSDLIMAFLDMVENHKIIVENSGLLTVAALKQLDRIDPLRRQHGRHYHVLGGTAGPDPSGPCLYRIHPPAGSPRRTGACGGDHRPGECQCYQTGTQPVRYHQSFGSRGAAYHHGSLWH